MSDPNSIIWDETIKKEARGINDADFGEIQEIGIDYVMTKKGVVGKDKFYLPKSSVDRFDGSKVYFNLTEEEAEKYKKD